MNPPALPFDADAARTGPAGPGAAEEQKLVLLEYWRSIAKRKRPILALTLLAAIVAAAVALALTPVYRSTATVQIETGKAKILSFEDVFGAGPLARENYQTQVEIIKARQVAERTARTLQLWDHPEFDPRQPDGSWPARLKAALGIGRVRPAWSADELTAAATEALIGRISVDPVRSSNLAKVSVDAADRDLAALAANTVVESYIEADRDARFEVSQRVSSYLQERLGSLREKLASSEQALQDYRDSKGIVSLAGSSQVLASQQAGGTTERMLAARARRLELESAAQQVHAVSGGDYSGLPWIARDPAVAEVQRLLNDARRRLAEMSQTLGSEHSKVLQAKAEIADLTATLGRQSAAAASSLAREYQAARDTESSLERSLTSARASVKDLNREEFQLTVLEREVQTNRELYDMFMSRAKETNLAGDVQASVARLVDPAVPAAWPTKPLKTQIVVVAVLLALVAGAMVAIALERLDNTVKGGDDAESRLHLPLLTALPALGDLGNAEMARLFIDEPDSHHAEAIRTARTGVLLSSIDHSHKILLVTSTVAGEGKTTVAINLALAHAQTKRTLLIDADMRRPEVGRRLGVAGDRKGLTNLVAGQAPANECLHRVAGSPLLVMPVGDLPPNPLELLLSQSFRDALLALHEQFEIVIIDSPPVEMVSEALVIAPQATSTVLVVKAMATPAPQVRRTIARLQRAGANMLGVIVNHLDFSKARYYHGQYGADAYGGAGYGHTYAPAPGLKPAAKLS